MKEDIERLYLSNVRLASDAYNFLLEHSLPEDALRALLSSTEPIITLESVKSAISESSKIPMLDTPKKISGQREEREQGAAEEQKHIIYSVHEQNGNGSIKYGDWERAQSANMSGSGKSKADIILPAKSKSEIGISKKSEKEKIGIAEKIKTEISNLAKEKSGDEKDKSDVEAQISRNPSFVALAKEYSPNIKIHNHGDVSGQSRCTGSVDDFVAYFRDRYKQEAGILRQRGTNLAIVRLDQLKAHPGEDVRAIVMVSEKRSTPKGNIWLEVEDEYGSASVLISENERFIHEAKNILRDDIIAIDGRVGQEFFIAKAITYPDIPVIRQTPKVEEDLAVVYLSDLHVGSKYFIEKAFKRFLRWMWGEEKNPELAGKVKYIVIAGDLVDGIGVYPTQERELVIKDIYEQYKAFDQFIQTLPDYVEVIIGPGNHDAVRRGEPQPYIPMEMLKSDVKKIGSPSSLEIEGFSHLIYHGTSMDSLISNMSGLSYAKPEGPMMEMLKRRHLSPIYGESLIVPELRDFMVISQEPDVFHTGHVHKNAAMKYRGTLLINSGTYQDRTDFQAKMGHIPTPGITPVLELKSNQLTHMKFLEEGL